MSEKCIVTWKGVGKSLSVTTKTADQEVKKNAYLDDIVALLDTLSKDRGWRVKCTMGEKGVFRIILFKPKKEKQFEHLIVYWTGEKHRVEITPQILSYAKLPQLNSMSTNDLLATTDLLSMFNWKLRSVSSTRGVYVWIYCKKIKK